MSRPENAELVALRDQCERQRMRISILQTYADRHGAEMVNRVVEGIHDASSAEDAATSFDAAWFDQLPYSPHVVRQIARRLIDAMRPYPFIDTQHIVRKAEIPA